MNSFMDASQRVCVGWRIGSPLCRSTEMHSRGEKSQLVWPQKIFNCKPECTINTNQHYHRRRRARKSLRSRLRATEEEWDSSSIIGISWMRCCRDLSTIKICSASRPSFHLDPFTARQHHSVTHSRIMRPRRRQLCWQRHVREGKR